MAAAAGKCRLQETGPWPWNGRAMVYLKVVAKPISPEDAAAYAERWRLVEAVERRELREEPVELKLRQLETLAGAVDALGWREVLEAEDSEVWERWRRLRTAAGE